LLRIGGIVLVLVGAGITVWLWTRSGGHGVGESTEASTPNRPMIIMEGLKTSVTNGGKLRQQIEAQTGVMDERENIVDMTGVRMHFFEQGELRGEARCDTGRLWQAERPAEGHGANDMLLSGNVHYRSTDGQVLESPVMNYISADRMLRTTAGYIRQTKDGDSYWIDRGELFEVTLLLNKGTFQRIHEHSNTGVVIEKSDKPVIEP